MKPNDLWLLLNSQPQGLGTYMPPNADNGIFNNQAMPPANINDAGMQFDPNSIPTPQLPNFDLLKRRS